MNDSFKAQPLKMADAGSAPKPVAASVARIRFLSYVRATRTRWQGFCDEHRSLRPLLQTDDVRKLVAVLDRHGRKRAEEAFNMPVELVLEILSYALPPAYDFARTTGDEYKNPDGSFHSLGNCSPMRGRCLQRALLVNSAMYFLVCENEAVKNPGNFAQVPRDAPYPSTKKPRRGAAGRPIPRVNGRPVIAAAPPRRMKEGPVHFSDGDDDLLGTPTSSAKMSSSSSASSACSAPPQHGEEEAAR